MVQVAHQNNSAELGQRPADRLRARGAGDLLLEVGGDLAGGRFAGGDQQYRIVAGVLGLGQEVSGHGSGIGRLVGNYQYLTGAGQ